MRHTDARQLGREALTALRRRAVDLVLEGRSPELVAPAVGVHRSALYKWLAAHRVGGAAALEARRRGGRPSVLDAATLHTLKAAIERSGPERWALPFHLWSLPAVAAWVRIRSGIRISAPTVSRLLSRLGLHAPHPLVLAAGNDPEAYERWLRDDYVPLRRLARRHKALVVFYDDGRGWMRDDPQGRAVEAAGRIVISAVSAQGCWWFRGCRKVNERAFIDFVGRLIRESDRMIFLVVGDTPVLRSKTVLRYAASVASRLRLSYGPQPPGPVPDPPPVLW